MNRILATVIAICFLGNTVMADEIEGNFSCKVLSTSVTAVEEGKLKKYSGYQDGMDAGDKLFIKYWLATGFYPTFFTDVKSPDSDFYTAHSGTFEAPDKPFSTHYPNTYYTENKQVFLDTDEIELSGVYDFILERYYKDDWQGIMVKTSGASVFVATLDCRHPRNSLDKITDFLREKFED